MKFIFGYPFFVAPPTPDFLKPEAVGKIAAAAEEAGFHAAYFSEHPAPTKNWRDSGGHDALDPFVALAFVAAATKNLRLLTNLTVLPYRNPLLLAKSVSTLDLLSGGRLTLGVGTGYLKGEYFALGADFDERNERFDEAVEVMKQAFTGEPINYEGKDFSAKDIVSMPQPIQLPHPPFWLGGNSKLTRRRVAEWGQGWMPMPNPKKLAGRRRSAPLETVAELKEMIAYMTDHAASVGRTEPIDIIYMTFEGGMLDTKDSPKKFDLPRHLEAIAELAEAGVSHLIVAITATTEAEILEQLDFAGENILKFNP